MGNVDWLAVVLGALAFFVIGAVWYGPLFGALWRGLNGIGDGTLRERRPQNPMWLILLLAFLLELLIAMMLGHNIARAQPAPHVIMMMAVGFGLTIMAPALGIHYLFQRRPGLLFAIDAGYFVVGMAAMGGVFALLA